METQNSGLSTMSHTDHDPSVSAMSDTDDVLRTKLAESVESFIALFARDKGRLRASVDKLRELAATLNMCVRTPPDRKLPSLCAAVGAAALGAGVGVLTGAACGAYGGVLTAACGIILGEVGAVGTVRGVFGSVVGGAAGGAVISAMGGAIGSAYITSGGSVQWHKDLCTAAAVVFGCITGCTIGSVFGGTVGGAGGAIGGAFGGLCGEMLSTGTVGLVTAPLNLKATDTHTSNVNEIVLEFQETIGPLAKELEAVKAICVAFRDPGAAVQVVASRCGSVLAAVDCVRRDFAECAAASTKHGDGLAARFEMSARQGTQTIEELEKIGEELGHFLASMKGQMSF